FCGSGIGTGFGMIVGRYVSPQLDIMKHSSKRAATRPQTRKLIESPSEVTEIMECSAEWHIVPALPCTTCHVPVSFPLLHKFVNSVTNSAFASSVQEAFRFYVPAFNIPATFYLAHTAGLRTRCFAAIGARCALCDAANSPRTCRPRRLPSSRKQAVPRT